ncbi:MAG: acyl-CoA dehydrogenase family protein [Rhizobiales bacterium]|nr:acyl-CoA dehydrogenase family protein [Hyphomicrobiales bacterium]OJU38123.1 MAG: acyl-CoA dehydrogenase [Rhizobiales bacterium 68-8]
MPAIEKDPRDMNALPDAEFRAELRAFLNEAYPDHLRYLDRRPTIAEIRPWLEALAAKGWLAPHWPREHGGMGLSIGKYLIYYDELGRHGTGRLPDHALHLLGPLLIRYGTPAQKARFLPAIVEGREIWCQGYSEPGAGSDLSSLRTEAIVDDDHFVVNGQKIWTSMAPHADWIFLLVRTNRSVAQQAGISFLLADMKTPGITVRPIMNLKGESEFAEVFFDNVRVPLDNLVGEIDKGWTMAKSLLGDERITLGSPRQSAYAIERLELLARKTGAFADAAFVDRLTQLRLDLQALGASFRRYVGMVERGVRLGPDVSMLKVWATELFQRITAEMVELGGEMGSFRHAVRFEDTVIDVMNQYLEATPPTIYGGSNEIQRNILAKAVLGLPG